MEEIELDTQYILNDYGKKIQITIIKDGDKYIVEEY